MASKVLQTPTIIEIIGSTIRIQHPDISGYTRTEVTSPLTAAGTTLTVADNNNFEDNDFMIIGEKADAKTEEIDVNGAVTRGTSITITNTTKFSHEIHSPAIRIQERAIKIYGAATDGGSGTLIASVDAITTPIADAVSIQWDKSFTEWTLASTDTAYAYYYVQFTDGTTSSSASNYVLAAGLGSTSVSEIVDGGLRKVNAKIDGEMITREWLLELCNDFQDEVTNYVTSDGVSKDWSFEIFDDVTSVAITQNENKYALSGFASTLKYTDSKEALLNMRLGTDLLKYVDITKFDEDMVGKVRTEVKTEAAAASTSLVVDDSYELTEAGTMYVAAMTVTYTTNTEATGTLTGIPASGTGYISATAAVDDVVWQGVAPGTPKQYTIFDGNILLNIPPNSDWVGYKLKIRALKKLDRLTSFSSVTEIPFTHLAKTYIASQVEYKKGNEANGDRLLSQFKNGLELQARKDKTQVLEYMTYYNYDFNSTNDEDKIFNN